MGKLTRKRTQARIVKKSRRPIAKGNAPNLEKLPMSLRPHWDKNLSVTKNYERLGINAKPSPSFRQTSEGHKMMKSSVKRHFGNRYKRDMEQSESEESDHEVKAPKISLSVLFPEIKSEAEAPFKKTLGKLKWDESLICKKLIAKYDMDYKKMARDIKVNKLQWTVGVIKKFMEIYWGRGYDKQDHASYAEFKKATKQEE